MKKKRQEEKRERIRQDEERENIRQDEERKRLHELEQVEMIIINNSDSYYVVKEKNFPYDEKGDLDTWFSYFKEATNDWEEKNQIWVNERFLDLQYHATN